MHAWIFVVFLTVASLGPYLSRYDNPDAEWAELAGDEAVAEPAVDDAAAVETREA